MKHVPADVYRAVQENDVDAVLFSDPFSSVTRQYKRNLLVASFVALLIAILHLEITGFLGLQASNANLGNLLAQGLACLVVVYFLVSFVFHVFADYSAWQFRRERQLTKPYLDLISLVESSVRVTAEQVNNATNRLEGVVVEGDMPSQLEASKLIQNSLGQLTSIRERIAGLLEETTPLLTSWSRTVRRMDRLDARLRMRYLSLWTLDIAFPIVFSLIALWSTADGVVAVFERIAG